MADNKASKPAMDSVIVGAALSLLNAVKKLRCTLSAEVADSEAEVNAETSARSIASAAGDVLESDIGVDCNARSTCQALVAVLEAEVSADSSGMSETSEIDWVLERLAHVDANTRWIFSAAEEDVEAEANEETS